MRKYSLPEELYRIIALRYIVRPAAAILPREVGVFVAKTSALPLFLIPSVGMLQYFQVREVFGLKRLAAFKIALRRVYMDSISYLYYQRVLYGREDPGHWPCIHENRAALDELVEDGQSFIIATGHFFRQAILPSKSPDVLPVNQVHISIPYPDVDFSFRGFLKEVRKRTLDEALHDFRVYMQYHSFHDAGRAIPGGSIEFCFLDQGVSAVKTINKRLRERGNALFVHIDAPWNKKGAGSLERPFAGMRCRLFATGAAKLSRKSGRPILPLTYRYDHDQCAFVYEWGKPIYDGKPEEIMHRLIDIVEKAVGEHPDNYQMVIGNERHWDADARLWRDP